MRDTKVSMGEWEEEVEEEEEEEENSQPGRIRESMEAK